MPLLSLSLKLIAKSLTVNLRTQNAKWFGRLMCVKCRGVLEGHRKIGRLTVPVHTRETEVNAPTTTVYFCLASQEECMPSSLKNDKAIQLKQSLRIPNAVYVTPVALQNKFSFSSKFSKNPGSLPKKHTHVVSTSRKYMAGFLVKSFGGFDGCLLLAVK